MRRLVIYAYAALTASLAAASYAAREATEGIQRFIAAALAWVLVTMAESFNWRLSFGPALALDGPPLHYDAPAQHYLRHEAGMSRRASRRNV